MNIAIGTPIRITDGTPRPPSRFTKKVQAWHTRNKIAIACGPSRYSPNAIMFQERTAPHMCGIMKVIGEVPLSQVIVLPGEALPMDDDDFHPTALDVQFVAWCHMMKPVHDAMVGMPLPA